jgi:hypothetical protein
MGGISPARPYRIKAVKKQKPQNARPAIVITISINILQSLPFYGLSVS